MALKVGDESKHGGLGRSGGSSMRVINPRSIRGVSGGKHRGKRHRKAIGIPSRPSLRPHLIPFTANPNQRDGGDIV
jgi:hypothetical protein